MSFFNSLFSGHPKTTKMKVASLAASAIDYVISDAGFKTLISGSLVLDKRFHPSSSGGKPKIGYN